MPSPWPEKAPLHNRNQVGLQHDKVLPQQVVNAPVEPTVACSTSENQRGLPPTSAFQMMHQGRGGVAVVIVAVHIVKETPHVLAERLIDAE
jgi:hypothetical protein